MKSAIQRRKGECGVTRYLLELALGGIVRRVDGRRRTARRLRRLRRLRRVGRRLRRRRRAAIDRRVQRSRPACRHRQQVHR